MVEAVIVSHTKDDKSETLVIKAKTKLGDIGGEFPLLPHGIINKTETGIGATWMELNSKRNSIIVEPIKITASSKAKEFNALYVGSPTKYHSNKVYNKHIKQYLNDTSIKDKKIVVVADSLKRVIEQIGLENLHDYFLMLDEADSFQNDSKFRYSMEFCMDIYKMFPVENRALVSATIILFSDPELINEKITHIKYDIPTVREIEVSYTDNVHGLAIDKIGQKLFHNKDDKVLIAYNSVTGCYSLVKHLIDNKVILEEDIKILCSVASKDKVGKFYHELDSDKLPAKVNFVTSAYFSGFDIKEDYHLISISSTKHSVHALSEHKFKQIAGRCRNKLLSENIIYTVSESNQFIDILTKNELIEAAEIELKALDCLTNNYSKSPLLMQNLKMVRALIIDNTKENGHQFVRTDISGEAGISYLNIDAALESNRVITTVFKDMDALPKLLITEGHNVKITKYISATKVQKQVIEDITEKEQTEKIIKYLKSSLTIDQVLELAAQLRLNNLQRQIIQVYIDNLMYVEMGDLLKELENASHSTDTRVINKLGLSLMYETLKDDNLYKRNVRYHLNLGVKYQPVALIQKWNKVFMDTGIQKSFSTPTSAVKLTNSHFKTQKHRDGSFTLLSENPFKVGLILQRKDATFKEAFLNKVLGI